MKARGKRTKAPCNFLPRPPVRPHDSLEKGESAPPLLSPHSDPPFRRYCTFRNIISPFLGRERGREKEWSPRRDATSGHVSMPSAASLCRRRERKRAFLTISRLIVLCSALRCPRGRGRPRRAVRAPRRRPATSATTGGRARRPRRPPQRRRATTARATPRR